MKRKNFKSQKDLKTNKDKKTGISRRKFVTGAVVAGAGVAATSLHGAANAQSFKTLKKFYLSSNKVTMTISWLAQGNTSYSFITKEKGFWKKRGLDVDVYRGFGSTASIQVMGAGKFNFGLAGASALIIGASKGIKLQGVGTASYDAAMGIGYLPESNIKSPKDLEGKKMGIVPTSFEVPFLPAYAKRAGFDLSKVELIHMDNKIIEQALIQGSVDAISGSATSSVPKFLARKKPIQFILFSDAGFSMYSQTIVSQPEFIKKEPNLVQDFTDGLFEGIKYTLLNPDEALDIFFKVVPEHALTKKGREFTRLGYGLWQQSLLVDEVKNHGLGYMDMAKVTDMTTLIMDNVAKNAPIRPDPKVLFTNKFSGNVKVTDAEWETIKKNVAPYQKLIKGA